MIENREQYKEVQFDSNGVSEELPFCECGDCGLRVTNPGNRFISGHNNGYVPREVRICKCGCEEPFTCRIDSPQKFKNQNHYLKWMKDNHIDHFNHEGPVWNEGLTKETDERVARNGREVSLSSFGTTNGFKKGEENWSVLHQRELHSRWKGGTGNAPYPFDFDDELKSLIRERDNNIYQLCGRTKEEEGKNLCVHHIDYIKENLDPSNLITLCNSCNGKVNGGRKYWTKFFQQKLRFA